MLNDNKKKEELRERIEKIMDKHTKNLTKTGDKDFNPPEIISFDTVVMDKYEATNDLAALCESIRAEALKEAIKEIEEQVIVGSAEGYRQGGGYVKDGVLKVLAKLSKEEE